VQDLRQQFAENPQAAVTLPPPSPDSPQDLDEEHPRIQHRDHQAEDDPGNEPVQPTTGTKQQ
jgi:hypothetical protein